MCIVSYSLITVCESFFPDQAGQLAEFYLGGTSNIVPENFYNITDMFTDAFVTYPMECFVEYARKTQPVFQYIYSHQVFSQFCQTTYAKSFICSCFFSSRVNMDWTQMLDFPNLVSTMQMSSTSCKLIPPAHTVIHWPWIGFVKPMFKYNFKLQPPGGSPSTMPEEIWIPLTRKCPSWSSSCGPASSRLECPLGREEEQLIFRRNKLPSIPIISNSL